MLELLECRATRLDGLDDDGSCLVEAGGETGCIHDSPRDPRESQDAVRERLLVGPSRARDRHDADVPGLVAHRYEDSYWTVAGHRRDPVMEAGMLAGDEPLRARHELGGDKPLAWRQRRARGSDHRSQDRGPRPSEPPADHRPGQTRLIQLCSGGHLVLPAQKRDRCVCEFHPANVASVGRPRVACA
jgi:hypothetical protein